MSTKLNRRVFVVGVGMHRFGNEGIPATDMGYVAGVAALDDAGIDFPEVGALYNGYLGGGITAGVHLAGHPHQGLSAGNRPGRVVGLAEHWRKDGHQLVTDELVDHPVPVEDDLGGDGEVPVQEVVERAG